MTYMVFHMKTTLNIDDTVMNRLRREAACQGRTMSELVEAALRLLFHTSREIKKKKLPPLPTFNGGKELVISTIGRPSTMLWADDVEC